MRKDKNQHQYRCVTIFSMVSMVQNTGNVTKQQLGNMMSEFIELDILITNAEGEYQQLLFQRDDIFRDSIERVVAIAMTMPADYKTVVSNEVDDIRLVEIEKSLCRIGNKIRIYKATFNAKVSSAYRMGT